MADDLGYGDLGCFGATKIQTPNIDRIAESGIKFTDAHASSSVCTPSRYSVLTGRYCWRSWLTNGVLGGFGAPLIPESRLTVASLLKYAGYHTAAVGKWHVGLDWRLKSGHWLQETNARGNDYDGFDIDYAAGVANGPNTLGFDYWFGVAGSLDMPPYCFIENGTVIGSPTVEKNPYMPQQRRGLMDPEWSDELIDTTFTERALDFIDQHMDSAPDEPFFLYLTPSAPHRPCVPPAFVRGQSDAGPRGDMVMLVDWMVGQLTDTLEKYGILDQTLLLFTSDNGAKLTDYWGRDHRHWSNGMLRGQKADIYEGGHRVPLVAMWPNRIPPGSESNQVVGLTDFLATCADIINFELDEHSGEDSMSVCGALSDSDVPNGIHDAIVHHSASGMFGIRAGYWKLIRGLGSGGFSQPRQYTPQSGQAPEQLYNLRDDLRETLNLWNAQRSIAWQLGDTLERFQLSGRSR